MNTVDNQVTSYIACIGMTYRAAYCGETMRGSWKCDAWRVTFERQGKSLSTEFFTGLGHRKLIRSMPKCNPRSIFAEGWKREYEKTVAPSAASVLYSLLMDSVALDTSFDYWCNDYGYDNGSITAQDTYRACCEIGYKVRRRLTVSERETLSTMLQDY